MNLQSAVQLSQGYLEIARSTADPRFISYAQATLAPWLKRTDVPPTVLVLSATALQSMHQFDAAIEQLDRALASTPQDAQAWLLKATILQVQGKFSDARSACTHLVRTGGQMIAITCLTGVNSLSGRLDASYHTLRALFTSSPALPASLSSWISGQLGEMAERRGDLTAAEDHLLAALRAAPDDIYLKAAYADLLLDTGRNKEVIALLKDNEQQDVLLLRLAIAGHRLNENDARRWADSFEARYQAARRDGDSTHLREQARFMLEVRAQPALALRLAQRNWQVQREPADIRIYLQTASAARQARSSAQVLEWMSAQHYEDRRLDKTRVALSKDAQS